MNSDVNEKIFLQLENEAKNLYNQKKADGSLDAETEKLLEDIITNISEKNISQILADVKKLALIDKNDSIYKKPS